MPFYRNISSTQDDLIFIHIPKTGGSYISNQLDKSAENVLTNRIYHHNISRHYTLEDIQSFNEIRINSTFIFTLIRNPISKIISTYYFFKNCKILFPEMDMYLDFVEKTMSEKTYLDYNYLMSFLKENRIDLNHFRPQVEFVQSEILRIHCYRLESQLKEISDLLSSKYSVDISQLNFRNNHFDKITDSQKERIRDLYKEDFDYFNY
jgi:hypothetical protein